MGSSHSISETCFFCKTLFQNLNCEIMFQLFKEHQIECKNKHNKMYKHRKMKAEARKVLEINGRRMKIWSCACSDGFFFC